MQTETPESAPDTTPDTGADAPDTGSETVETQETGEGDGSYTPPELSETTEEEGSEEGAEQEAAPAEPAPLPVALISRAIRAGLDEADILEANGDPRALELAVRVAERKGGNPASEKSAADASPGVSDVKKVLAELEDLGDDVEPSLAKAVNTLKAVLGQLANSHESVFGQLTQRDHAAAIERFDNTISGLDNAKELFGEGGRDDLDPASTQFANRVRLWKEAEALKQAYAAKGERVPSYNTLLKKAHQLAFGGNLKESARREIASSVKTRGRQISSPPSQRKAPSGGRSSDPLAEAKAAALRTASKFANG